MEDYIIPRNIKAKETLAYGLSGKQILYVGAGAGLSLFIWTAGASLPLDPKIIGTVFAISGSLALSLAKVHGQPVDRYLVNSIKYPIRQKEFGGDDSVQEKGPLVRIRYSLQ